jgi:hypothetical protein
MGHDPKLGRRDATSLIEISYTSYFQHVTEWMELSSLRRHQVLSDAG